MINDMILLFIIVCNYVGNGYGLLLAYSGLYTAIIIIDNYFRKNNMNTNNNICNS